MKICIVFLVFFFVALQTCSSLPRFEVYWESRDSYSYNDDENHNPWYIDLDAIDVGAPGYFLGPNVVTIYAADFCTVGCQENYPDEYCSQYPPEGIPARPRTVDDWGTKFNITADMMKRGIDKIHQRGGKVNLAYGGYSNGYGGYGISAENGGGLINVPEDRTSADQLAKRIAKNVEDWNLDGVDFFFSGSPDALFWAPPNDPDIFRLIPGNSALFHLAVIKTLRLKYLPASKTISYSTNHDVSFKCENTETCTTIINAVIAAAHPFLDWISFKAESVFDEENLIMLARHGVPLSKIGAMLYPSFDHHSEEQIAEWAYKIKTEGLAGFSLFSINMENTQFHGSFAKMVAEFLYS